MYAAASTSRLMVRDVAESGEAAGNRCSVPMESPWSRVLRHRDGARRTASAPRLRSSGRIGL